MKTELINKLGQSESPYLREAASQPVHWQVFSDEAFRIARELDRPILLDIGAVWCHWCHVMDNESYTDSEVAEIINKYFVPVKVDRDQMPDVDARYQTAIGAITGTGGWPLTGFLTPDGKVFYGGTYFPKRDLQGRPGLLSLLPQIVEVYAKRKDDVIKSAEEIFQQLKEYEKRASQAGELSEQTIKLVIDDARLKFDKEFGGFGSAPKFFNATALQLLTGESLPLNDPAVNEIVQLTLDNMAKGGIYDQIGGGFHRYSVDRYWHVPHFEKMLYDNALMLKMYLRAFETIPKVSYSRIASETAEWIAGNMQSSEGAFYAHQDADVGPYDDGSYWTWTKEEIESTLTDDEAKVVELYFDIREMPNDTREFPERNVLRVAVSEADIAKNIGKSLEDVEKLAAGAKKKMFESRNKRKTPFIDKTVLADRNGLAISALVDASLVLKTRKFLQSAERAAEFILDNMVDSDGEVAHAFSGHSVLYEGLLGDQVYFGISLLDLFDVMRNDRYLDSAEKIAQVLQEEFEDKTAGGFFDRSSNSKAEGMLSTQKKPIEDSPTPSGNSCAAIFFDRLFVATENRKYFEIADKTLKAFAGSVDKLGMYSANYASALRLHFNLQRNLK
ncbi:MAG: thioredoxin domain-containing protein [Bacteroidetes bacterium]|nr:thioredoxin domain-containing protein [Bacteroidota bacterium]MCL5738111.1 thioredoxin domain-containing protein [Bacteroidota bacterium]